MQIKTVFVVFFFSNTSEFMPGVLLALQANFMSSTALCSIEFINLEFVTDSGTG